MAATTDYIGVLPYAILLLSLYNTHPYLYVDDKQPLLTLRSKKKIERERIKVGQR